MHASQLSIALAAEHGKAAVLTVAGDLDLHTSDLFDERIAAAVRPGITDVVLEMSQVSFCDSTGLSALIILFRRLNAEGGHLALAAPPDRLFRLLQMTGIHQLIPSHPSSEAALQARGHIAPGEAGGPDRP
ncbi:STAS domain-containing protein [Actinocorallia libanotica]|uniref:Anti-sigma factor antagonist n=1 Tax=Actinocorallia libanotica TaxID=46162 RepID=A0ABP4CER1_9ACTN